MKLQEAEATGSRLEAPDVVIENHGSVTLVRPLTPAAHEWVDEHVPLEGWQWFGGAFACEPRYVDNLIEGMINNGLEVQ